MTNEYGAAALRGLSQRERMRRREPLQGDDEFIIDWRSPSAQFDPKLRDGTGGNQGTRNGKQGTLTGNRSSTTTRSRRRGGAVYAHGVCNGETSQESC
ncbi:MAG: hypothetical protein ACJA1R_002653, partial [Flavobacteriales bacterium]